MGIKYKYSVYADIGAENEENRQNFFANGQYMNFKEMKAGAAYVTSNPGNRQIFALMKDEKSEARASNLAALFLDRLRKKKNKLRVAQTSEYLRQTLLNMDRGIRENLQGEDGTTLTMLYINNGNAHAACVGNDTIYKYYQEDNRLEKPENTLSANGRLGKHPEVFGPLAPFVTSLGKVNPRKNYLLLSDSLDRALSPEEIVEILSTTTGNVAQALAEKAEENGANGNVCAIYVQPKKKKWWLAPLILLILIAGFFAVKNSGLPELLQNIGKDTQTETVAVSDGQTGQDSAETVDVEKTVPGSMRALKKELDGFAEYITGDNSNVTYYVKDIKTGEEIYRNAEQKMDADRLIDLYIMAEIYRLADDGTITMSDSVKGQIESMLVKNDDASREALLLLAGNGEREAGVKAVTENATKKLGCTATALQADEDTANETSAKDCGTLLEMMYKNELVSAEASAEMLDLLKAQQNKDKIPHFLPDGTTVANRSGETSAVQNDTAIVYTEKGDFILSVMISDYTNSSEEAEDVIASMSEAVFNYITDES
ncbi:MAG: serine hydrolase [Clostridia bacterium]|nr:serine hydrolase [Clostridia bacterium]